MRRVARDQWLLASSTTEGQNGGNIRASAAAVDVAGDTVSLLRDATVISYGAEADGLVTIARRATDASASDQVLLALARDDYSLKRTLGWVTLGMRGTCSTGFELAVETVMHAMRTAGLSGYRNDGEFTMGRHLRDVLSSPIMINNDRILANAATSTLMSGVPLSLHD